MKYIGKYLLWPLLKLIGAFFVILARVLTILVLLTLVAIIYGIGVLFKALYDPVNSGIPKYTKGYWGNKNFGEVLTFYWSFKVWEHIAEAMRTDN